jgi:predicted nuclease of predicted toxin-antitoxin system
MKFIADENFPRLAIAALRKTGSEVISVAEEMPAALDHEILGRCAEEDSILLTMDKDRRTSVPAIAPGN